MNSNKFHQATLYIILIFSTLSNASFALTVSRGPYLQMATDHSITIRWRTDSSTDSTVYYGNSPGNLYQTVSIAGNRTEHEINIDGLPALTTYYYAVGNNSGIIAGNDSSYRFTTSPTPGTASQTRVWLIGDSGTANSNAASVYNAYLNYPGADNTNLWIMLGDNAYNDGTDSEYQSAVFNMYPELLRRTPLWPTLGNHDGHSADSATESGPYYQIHTLPRNGEAGGLASGTEAYYSFDYGNIHFICLDSYETNRSPGGAMMTWLENDLAANDKQWTVAFWHHPPYTKGSHDSDTENALIDMRANALPILENYGVDLVFSGHSHSYERSFLIDGHYGLSGSFSTANLIDGGDGREDGNGAYGKANQAIHAGAVYTVAGASGKISGGSLDHPAMFTSLNQLGSVILDINGNQLDAFHLRSDGVVTDYYTINKGPDTTAPALLTVNATSNNQVNVTFSEAVTATSAETISHYSIDNGITVISASLSGNTAILTTSTLTEGVYYTLTVNNIEDLNGNIIAPDSQAGFQFQNLQTISFQNGVLPDNSYSGTEDSYISSGGPANNFGTSAVLLADGDDGTNGELVSLIKWEISSIPANASITEAHIELEVFNPSSGTYNFYNANSTWSETSVTWDELDPYTNRGLIIGSLQAGVTGNYSISLNSDGISLLQNWVNGAPNYGILIMTGGTNNGIDLRSSEYSNSTLRPKLIVTYTVESGGNTAPVAGFDFISNNLNVDFTDTSSDSDGIISAWFWDFGDNSNASIQDPSHSYLSAGTYQVSLTVTDDDNASHSTTQAVNVTDPSDNEAPSIPTGLSTDNITSDSVTLSWNPATDNTGIAGYKLRRDNTLIADQLTSQYTDANLSSNTTYGYTVEAYDLAGNHSGESAAVMATTDNIAPIADFDFNTNQLNVSFTDTSSDSDGNIVNWSWNFSDGNHSNAQHPTHQFNLEGSYDVSLTVTDSNGASDTAIQAVTVNNAPVSTTVTLQQGLNAYSGAQDTYIAEGSASSNYGHASDLLADGDDGRRDELIALLKFDVTQIPAGVTVTDAILTLQVHNKSNNVYQLWSLTSFWDENSANWNNVLPWSHQESIIASFTPSSTGSYVIQLNAAGIALVQSWIDGGSNNGLSIVSGGTRNGVDIRSSEYGNQSQRPALTITY